MVATLEGWFDVLRLSPSTKSLTAMLSKTRDVMNSAGQGVKGSSRPDAGQRRRVGHSAEGGKEPPRTSRREGGGNPRHNGSGEPPIQAQICRVPLAILSHRRLDTALVPHVCSVHCC